MPSDRKQISKALTIKLIKAHGIMCQNCKKEEYEHVHHIDRNPNNSGFSNLMLLCSKCHTKEHDRDRFLRSKYTRLIRIRLETYNRLTKYSTIAIGVVDRHRTSRLSHL